MKKYLTLVAFSMVIGNSYAQKPAVVVSDKAGWHRIGETTVSFDRERDEVAVMLSDRFAALKFKVTDAPIELLNLDLYFEDGSTKNVVIGYAIKNAGETSKVIDLPGVEKDIKKIAFTYKTLPNRPEKKAHVEIWGMKTNADSGKMKSDMRDAKNEVKDGASDVKEDAHDMKHDMKKEGKDMKKDMKKDAKDMKKDAKDTKDDIKNDMKDNK